MADNQSSAKDAEHKRIGAAYSQNWGAWRDVEGQEAHKTRHENAQSRNETMKAQKKQANENEKEYRQSQKESEALRSQLKESRDAFDKTAEKDRHQLEHSRVEAKRAERLQKKKEEEMHAKQELEASKVYSANKKEYDKEQAMKLRKEKEQIRRSAIEGIMEKKATQRNIDTK